jgi:copper chaperone
MTEITYAVSAMSCSHCTRAVTSELSRVAGVEKVDVLCKG